MTTSTWIALVSLMAGTWSGKGQRYDHRTNSSENITVQTKSSLVTSGFISKNLFNIEKSNGDIFKYQRNYWMRPSTEIENEVELGSGEIPTTSPTSRGFWDGHVLKVNQKLGGGYEVATETSFSGLAEDQHSSKYTEIFMLNHVPLTTAEIIFLENK